MFNMNFYYKFNKWLYIFLKRRYVRKFDINRNDYYIVSLGWNCVSRVITTRWELKKTKNQGETSDPFDLCMHDVKFLPQIIRSSFKNYFDDVKKINDKLWENDKLKILYNHDDDLNTKEEFIERYKKRIDSFFGKLQSSKPILFIYNSREEGTDDFDDIIELKNTLYDLIQNNRNKAFLCIITNKEKIKERIRYIDGITCLCISQPTPKYVWYDPTQFFTYSGYKFEKKIVSAAYNLLKEILKDSEKHSQYS